MAAYVIAEISVDSPDLYENYKELVAPTLSAYGGRFVVRGGAAESVEGDWQPERIVVLRFDTRERARAWWSSTEYAPAKRIRQAAARSKLIIVDGVD